MEQNRSKSPSKSNNKKRAVIISVFLVLFIILLVILIVIWSRSDVNKISSTDFEQIIEREAADNFYTADPSIAPTKPASAQYKGMDIQYFTVNVGVGDNTTIISGNMTLVKNNGGTEKIAYSSQFDRDNWTYFSSGQGLGNSGKFSYYWADVLKLNPPAEGSPYFRWYNRSTVAVASASIDISGGTNKTNPPIENGGIKTSDRTFVPAWESAIITILPWILIFGLMTWFFLRMMRTQGGAGGLSIFNAGKNRARKEKVNVHFTDVAGIDEEKQELMELVDYLKQPQKYANLGARIPKGVLVEGPPGTGKTLLAKAVAGEAGVPFFSISGSEFEEIFVGVGASRIREMFNDAKKASPSIIFIDEIDAVGRRRTNSATGNAGEQTLNQLLVEMDGFSNNSGVIVIAATNFVEVLDPALLRPGRFDRKIQVTLPDMRAREAILKLHARNKNISSEIDFRRLALITPGFSGAQLENVLNEAAILCVRNNSAFITLEIVNEAIDRVVGGPAKKSRKYTKRDKNIVSFHEAGHALIGVKLKNASKVQKVTIIPRGNAGGYTIITPNEEIIFYSKEYLLANITGFLGGRASEELMFGKAEITTGAHDDLEKATNMSRNLVTYFGMSDLGLTQYESPKQNALALQKQYSEKTAELIDNQINKILNDCYIEAKKIISEHKAELKLMAKALTIMETITASDIEYIDTHMELPPKILKEEEAQKNYKDKKTKGSIIEVVPSSRQKPSAKKSKESEKPSAKKSKESEKATAKKDSQDSIVVKPKHNDKNKSKPTKDSQDK